MKRLRAWELRRRAAAFFLPNRCPFCDRIIGVTEFWCAGCYDRLKFVDSHGDIPEGLDGFSAVCSYTGRARSAVLRMKDGWYRYPIDAFAVLIAENAPGTDRDRRRDNGGPDGQSAACRAWVRAKPDDSEAVR